MSVPRTCRSPRLFFFGGGIQPLLWPAPLSKRVRDTTKRKESTRTHQLPHRYALPTATECGSLRSQSNREVGAPRRELSLITRACRQVGARSYSAVSAVRGEPVYSVVVLMPDASTAFTVCAHHGQPQLSTSHFLCELLRPAACFSWASRCPRRSSPRTRSQVVPASACSCQTVHPLL